MAKSSATLSTRGNCLPDVLSKNLNVVFCGRRPQEGGISDQTCTYYAHPNNRFWRMLSETQLTPRKLQPAEFRTLCKYGIGLTNLHNVDLEGAGSPAVNCNDVDLEELVAKLAAKIEEHAPRIFAFNSKTLADDFFKFHRKRGKADYGQLQRKIGTSEVWVLPSTAPTNGHWKKQADQWPKLADRIREISA